NNIWHLGGDILVDAGGAITGTGGSSSYSTVQIGHGSNGPTSTADTSTIAASAITVLARNGDLQLLSGTGGSTGAKIGHGNYNLKLASFGESPITVSASRHIRLISPQFATYTAVSNSGTQIGHGGFGATVGVAPSNL